MSTTETARLGVSSVATNSTVYELGTQAAAASHPSIIIGHILKTNYHNSNRVSGSGGGFAHTGVTTLAKASA